MVYPNTVFSTHWSWVIFSQFVWKCLSLPAIESCGGVIVVRDVVGVLKYSGREVILMYSVGVISAFCVLSRGLPPSESGDGQSLLGLCSTALSSSLFLLFPTCLDKEGRGFC